MSLACVLIPHLALRIAVFDRPALDGLPLVLTSPSTARPVVADCSPEATARGVKPGMPLREVTAVCADAVFIPYNPVAEGITVERLLDALETVSPFVEAAEPGRCYVDLVGLDRHHGSPEAAARQLLLAISPLYRPRVGIGANPFLASVAARKAPPGGVATLADVNVAATLAPLPASWLPIAPDLVSRLDRLGLRTIGEVAALSPSALQARFGPTGRRIAELGRGIDPTPFRPRRPVEAVAEEMALEAPTASRDVLLLAIHQLVARAFARPALRARHVRQARLRVVIEGAHSWERELTFREPVGGQRLIETLRARLQSLELSGPAEALSLELIGIVAEVATQELIPLLRPRQDRPLIAAARQLKQRYGSSPLAHIVEVEPWSRIPERRFALISYDP